MPLGNKVGLEGLFSILDAIKMMKGGFDGVKFKFFLEKQPLELISFGVDFVPENKTEVVFFLKDSTINKVRVKREKD